MDFGKGFVYRKKKEKGDIHSQRLKYGNYCSQACVHNGWNMAKQKVENTKTWLKFKVEWFAKKIVFKMTKIIRWINFP